MKFSDIAGRLPRKAGQGDGEIAVNIYNLNRRLYTVRIITKDSTVMNRPPKRVTAHRGIGVPKVYPWLILSMISWGSAVPLLPDRPDVVMMVDTIPWTILKTASIKSSP